MNRFKWRLIFAIGQAACTWMAWRGADQLLDAIRLIPRLTDVSAGVWVLLAAVLAGVVLSLVAMLMGWRALQAERLRPMLLWLGAGAVLSPLLVEAAGRLAERL